MVPLIELILDLFPGLRRTPPFFLLAKPAGLINLFFYTFVCQTDQKIPASPILDVQCLLFLFLKRILF